MGLLFGLCIFLVALLIFALLGGLLLRLACVWFNKMRGDSQAPQEVFPTRYDEIPESAPPLVSAPLSDTNPYAAPATLTRQQPTYLPEHTGRGVPVPSFGKAIGITLLRAVIDRVIGFVISFGAAAAFGPARGAAGFFMLPAIPLMLISLVFSFLVGALLLKLMLPTSFGRACAVQFVEYLIYLVIALVIALVVVGFFALVR